MGADSEIGMLNSLRVRAMLSAQHVNELVVAAIENSWETIRAHKDVMRNVTELILRDGIEAGEFEPVDPRETADHAICRGLHAPAAGWSNVVSHQE